MWHKPTLPLLAAALLLASAAASARDYEVEIIVFDHPEQSAVPQEQWDFASERVTARLAHMTALIETAGEQTTLGGVVQLAAVRERLLATGYRLLTALHWVQPGNFYRDAPLVLLREQVEGYVNGVELAESEFSEDEDGEFAIDGEGSGEEVFDGEDGDGDIAIGDGAGDIDDGDGAIGNGDIATGDGDIADASDDEDIFGDDDDDEDNILDPNWLVDIDYTSILDFDGVYDEPAATPGASLLGVVRVYATSLIYADLDLQLTPPESAADDAEEAAPPNPNLATLTPAADNPDKPNAKPATAGIDTPLAAPHPDDPNNPNAPPPDTDPGPPPQPHYFIAEKRRLRFNQIHYFDHPKFGAILGVWPVPEPETEDLPDEGGEPQ